MADNQKPTYSRRLTKGDGLIDWNKPSVQLEREIRAFTDWPKSRTTLAGKEVIITAASVTPDQSGAKPGDIHVTEDKTLLVQTSQGALRIEKLKPANKQEMSAKDFILGYGQLLK